MTFYVSWIDAEPPVWAEQKGDRYFKALTYFVRGKDYI